MVRPPNIRKMFDAKVEKRFIESNSLAFTISPTQYAPDRSEISPGFMPANVAFLLAFSTGSIGAIVVSAIAVRFTRRPWSLAFGGILSGAALGVLV